MKFDKQASKLLQGLNKINEEFYEFNLIDVDSVEDIINNSLYCFAKLVDHKKIIKEKEKDITTLKGTLDSNQEYIDGLLELNAKIYKEAKLTKTISTGKIKIDT